MEIKLIIMGAAEIRILRITAGKKGVSGKVLTIVIGLVIALVALYILWTFLMKSTPFVAETVTSLLAGFKDTLCAQAGLFETLCRWALGV